MRQQLPDCEGYSDSRGLFSARKAIMQYAQLKRLPNVTMDGIYTGNGVSELIQLTHQRAARQRRRDPHPQPGLPALDRLRHARRRRPRALHLR